MFPFLQEKGSGKIPEPQVEGRISFCSLAATTRGAADRFLAGQTVAPGATGKHISAARLHVILVGLEFGLIGPTRVAPHPPTP
jgi:hypothetical protein